MTRKGYRRAVIRVRCVDGKLRAFLTPAWYLGVYKRDEPDRYECGHCGEEIRLSKKGGDLKRHVCPEGDEQ